MERRHPCRHSPPTLPSPTRGEGKQKAASGPPGHGMRNYWYVAADAAKLTDKPLARKILSEPIVLFRDAKGRPAALSDKCRFGSRSFQRSISANIG